METGVGCLAEPLSGRRWDRRSILAHAASRAERYRRHGLEASDRVFLHFGNNLEFFADLLAVWSLGACAVPIDARLTRFEVEVLARAARPRLSLFYDEVDPDLVGPLGELGVEPLAVPRADAPGPGGEAAIAAANPPVDGDALILFTSGTTGEPKGVVHTHRSLRAQWQNLARCLGLDAYRRTLCLLPTHFGHGLICNCLFPWLAGCDLYVVPPFKPELVMRLGALVDEHEISFLSSVPSVWRLALKTAKAPERGCLERVFCGSAPLSAHLWEGIRDWTGTRDVWNAYGITETASWLAGTSVPGFQPEDGLVGVAWGGELAIRRSGGSDADPEQTCAPGESGFVWIRTPALMRGYFDRDDLTRKVVSGGWFSTGDIGVIDERGLLFLRGREREEINKGGTKVYPGDVDAVIERFEAVTDSCSFAVEDALYGQTVGVAVVLEDADDAILRDLHAFAKRRLADYQMPTRWYLLDAIPRTSRGKINRERVAEACASREPVALRAILRPPR